jgi:hypothetical protein
MGLTLDPVTLVANIGQDIPFGLNAEMVEAFRLTNESPFPLKIEGLGEWLPAWHRETFKNHGTGKLTVTPVALANSPGGQSSSLLVTIYYKGEPPPAYTSEALARQTSNTPQSLNYVNAIGLAGAAIDCPLPGSGNNNQFTYLVGFLISSGLGSPVNSCAVDFTGTNTLPEMYFTEAGNGGYMRVDFPKPVRSTGTNQAIHVKVASGNANRSILVWGYNA